MSYLLGLSTSVPNGFISKQDALSLARKWMRPDRATERLMNAAYRFSGVEKRGSVLAGTEKLFGDDNEFLNPGTGARMKRYSAEIVPLAEGAAQKVFEDGCVAPEEITHLLTVSCTGFFSPGLDVALTKKLGLRETVHRSNVGFVGCHGAVNALALASAMTAGNKALRALIVAAEICTIHFQAEPTKDNLVANALFADGAAAMIIGNGEDSGRFPKTQSTLSTLVPNSADSMTWQIGDCGFAMTLSPKVPALIEEHAEALISGWLRENNLDVAAIKSWAVHPGGPRILDAVENALKLSPEMLQDSRAVLLEHGNMSSPTVLFVLERLRQKPDFLPCVMLAFGPGLTIEAALLV